jgi:folate-binding Fe-S cluster repair protein YgfZ
MPVSQVSNMDIAGLCDRTTVYARELIASQSAYNGGFFLESDRARLATYLDRLEAFAVAANAQPLDLPKIHQVGFSLLKAFPTDTEIESVENQDVKDIIRRMKALWIDMSESQSADLASGINRFDLIRFRSIVESCRALLAMSGDSIDLPENIGNNPVPTATGTRSTTGGTF